MNDKIGNSIAKHQQIINELNELKVLVSENLDNKVKFCIHTREMFHSWEPYEIKHKKHMDISPEAMYTILNEAISKERERINKLIDMEIEFRTGKLHVEKKK